jgi:hypothetical protein
MVQYTPLFPLEASLLWTSRALPPRSPEGAKFLMMEDVISHRSATYRPEDITGVYARIPI